MNFVLIFLLAGFGALIIVLTVAGISNDFYTAKCEEVGGYLELRGKYIRCSVPLVGSVFSWEKQK